MRVLLRIVHKIIVPCCIISVFAALWLYFSQDKLIFPGAPGNPRAYSEPPEGVSSFFVTTEDGERIEVWTTYNDTYRNTPVGIIFHGNGEDVSAMNYLPFLKRIGVPAFTFDYRGYGKSTGTPSEAGIYKDADAVGRAVLEHTGVTSERLLILGNSIGSGPAAYLASQLQPRVLVLIAGYSSIPDVVLRMPQYAPFSFLLRYKFPTSSYLAKLQHGCVIIAHGARDDIIPPELHKKLSASVPAPVQKTVLFSEEAGHNDIFYHVETGLERAIGACFVESVLSSASH
jgi:fermentation-respiration switch protein FrsA (DUF1100 family)